MAGVDHRAPTGSGGTADSDIEGVSGRCAGDQGPTGQSQCIEVWYGRNRGSDELSPVARVPGRSKYIGVCALCDAHAVHYHLVIPTVYDPGEAIARGTRSDEGPTQ